jgi:hypothetical protein
MGRNRMIIRICESIVDENNINYKTGSGLSIECVASMMRDKAEGKENVEKKKKEEERMWLTTKRHLNVNLKE